MKNYNEFQPILEAAHAAGMDAGEAARPHPMIVRYGANLEMTDYIEDGVCGYAWIHFPKAIGPFINFLKAMKIGHRAYGGGYEIYCRYFDQSMQRKEAYAEAYAQVLKANGIDAYSMSRMD